MEKNDIFNTNLLQLPMKAQVADEGVVQDIAPVAAPADLAGGVAELELDALNQRGVVLQRLSDVTPKNHEMLASGRLQCGEITLLCGDGGVGKGVRGADCKIPDHGRGHGGFSTGTQPHGQRCDPCGRGPHRCCAVPANGCCRC